MNDTSKIFTSYRALGLISNDIPLVIRYIKRRKENLIVTVIGNSFHTYGEKKLKLLGVGNPHSSPITSLAADTYHVYTATGQTIYAWRRSTELIHTYSKHAGNVKLILPFGPHIISIDDKNVLYIWDIKSEEEYLQMEFSNNFEISSILHPSMYINKILLGSKQGKLHLWNIHTNKLLYTFEGWQSEVHVLEQAPAEDVVAIGLGSGEIKLHHLKFDETIVSFKQEWGPVTSISFRTDGPPIMVSGSTLGHIAIWDLEEKRLSSQIWKAHHKEVTGLKCLPNEPKMVTSSADNTLKTWIFDMPDGGARQLIIKEGHSAPPLVARFHGSLGESILSAGEDSTLRVFSTVTDLLNKSFGVASYNKKAAKKSAEKRSKLKMSPIVAFTSETTQETPWDSIACMHRNNSIVTTWSFEEQKMGEHKLRHKRFKKPEFINSIVSSVVLSVCGNYVIIGYNSGHVDKYNIQSGLHRGSFGFSEHSHQDTVSGVVSDSLNQIVVSGDQAGVMNWWNFKTLGHLHKLNFECGIAALHLHRDSGLLSVILDDWSLQVVDIDVRRVIRKLIGHSNQITDTAFTPNSKWLISSSLDRSIRTWDLPSGCCVDMFCVPVPASSVSVSPTGEFLATTHAGHLGIYLWANRSCFQHVSLSPLPLNFIAPIVALPSIGVDDDGRTSIRKGDDEEKDEGMESEEEEEYLSPDQISKDLVTLALLPTSRWLNLLHIDTIKMRGRPSKPLKVPKVTPFFIPTVPGLDMKFGVTTEPEPEIESVSKLKSVTNFVSISSFGKKLKEKEYEDALKILMTMGPTTIDTEIRELDPDTAGSEELALNFLKMIKHSLSLKKYFEVTEGYLSLYVKIHSDFIIKNEEAQDLCHKILICHKDSWHTIKDNLNKSLSVISYLKNAALINY